MQQAAVAEVVDVSLRVETREQAQLVVPAIAARDRALESAPRRDAAANASDVENLVALERERRARHVGGKLERQHAHADEVRAVDALEALGNDRAHAEEARPLRRPVA